MDEFEKCAHCKRKVELIANCGHCGWQYFNVGEKIKKETARQIMNLLRKMKKDHPEGADPFFWCLHIEAIEERLEKELK